MFGAGKTAFGAPASSAFGQSNTLFGTAAAAAQPAAQPTQNLFGQSVLGMNNTMPSFGATSQTNTIGWGTDAAAAAAAQTANGTNLAFNPPITTDTIQRAGQSTSVNAKHMCITAMKEYQFKSLEELRLEDYALNRQKGAGVGAVGGTSIFGGSTGVKPFQFGAAQPTTSTTSIFGQVNKPANTLFGSGGSNLMFGASTGTTGTAFGQPAQTQAGSVFGAKPLFGAASGTNTGLFGSPQPAASGFTFGQSQSGTGLGGTTTNLFGQSSLASTGAKPTLFGAQPATGSVLPFGQSNTGLFGVAKTTATPSLFGTATASLGTNPAQATNFTFGSGLKPAGTTNLFGTATGATAANTLKPGGIFGAPASSGTTFGFGTGLSTGQTAPAFGSFGTGATAASNATGLFGQPAANSLTAKKTFGFGSPLTNATGTTVSSASGTPGVFGFGAQTGGGGLFGAATSTAPAFGLGTNTGATGSLFGSTGTTGFGLGQKPGTLGGGLGTTGFGQGFGLGATNTGLGGSSGLGLGLGAGLGTGGGLFGAGTGGTGTSSSFSFGAATSTTPSFGGGLTGLGMQQSGTLGTTLGVGGGGLAANSAEQMAQNVRAQQQVLELVRSMPYGQSPLFRYLNTSISGDSSGADATNKSGATAAAATTTGSGGTTVVPAKLVANALAERHKAAGLTVGSGSPNGVTGAALNRNMWMRRPAVTQRLLQISNRNKLFSGFYEDDALLSPAGQSPGSPSGLRLRRSSTVNTDVTGLDRATAKYPGGGTSGVGGSGGSGGFFVRRDEWKRLHLPESVRASILERSASSVTEMSSLAEAAIDADRPESDDDQHAPHGDGSKWSKPAVTVSHQPSSPPATATKDTLPSQPAPTIASRSLAPSAISTPTTPRTGILTADTGRARPPLHTQASHRSGVGMVQARQALQTGARDDSTLLDDPDTTWTSPNELTSIETSPVSGRKKAGSGPLANGASSPSGRQVNSPESPNGPASPTDSLRPAGIKLTRPGYYTLPTLEELASMVDEDGRCVVEDFVIGRRRYGHILFPGLTDLTNIDLDAVVHIRRREVVVYPDDDDMNEEKQCNKKPAVGLGLNKRAEICLESIWPTDKSTGEPIKSPERLALMRFEDRLERATRRMDARFIEYRPESGSWVFEVKHFSKYGLQDSDDEEGLEEQSTGTHGPASGSVDRARGPRSQPTTAAPSTHILNRTEDPMATPKPPMDKTANGLDDDEPRTDRFLSRTTAVSQFSVGQQQKLQFDQSVNFLSPKSQLTESQRFAGAKNFGTDEETKKDDRPVLSPSESTAFDAQRLSAPTHNMVQQMRQAFFSPARAAGVTRRVEQSVFMDEEPEELDDDEVDDWSNRFGSGDRAARNKRFPPPPVLFTAGDEAPRVTKFGGATASDYGENKSFLTRSGVDTAAEFTTLWTSDIQSSGPTPEKFPRTLLPSAKSAASKWEAPSPESAAEEDDESLYESGQPNAGPRTPFRPILYAEVCEGVPLTPGHQRQPPIQSDLELARIPEQLKRVSPGALSSRLERIAAGLFYPYATLAALLKSSKPPRSDSHQDALSHYSLDAGLWHGHSMRPSWGLCRVGELHVITLTNTNTQIVPSKLPEFAVDINTLPTAIELIDENLLNAALLTSVRGAPKSTSYDAQSVQRDQLLHPSMDHCPQWEPVTGLAPLEAYARALQCDFPDCFDSAPMDSGQSNARVSAMRRLIGLCLALWGRHPQEASAAALEQQMLLDEDNDGGELPTTARNDREHRDQTAGPFFCEADVFEPRTDTPAMRSLARKQAVSEWIRAQSFSWLRARLRQLNLWEVAIPPTDSTEINSPKPATGRSEFPLPRLRDCSTESVGEGIWACLVSGEPGAACRLALAAAMPGLASLVAQSTSGDVIVRRGLQRQLQIWHEMKYDQHIPLIILRIYALLAGRTQFPHPKSGNPVTVLANLDWIRVFGAYLWYMTDYATDLSDVLSTYSWAWHASDPRSDQQQAIARPVPPEDGDLIEPDPPHLLARLPTDYPSESNPDEHCLKSRSWPRDTAYHLIQLFCRVTHRLERTLDPCGIRRATAPGSTEPTCRINPANLIDWAPSWMLWRVLLALGYHHFESTETGSRLCAEFAAQLEQVGLWEWAVFVWLHEPDQTSRDAAVKSVVARHVSLVPPGRSQLVVAEQSPHASGDQHMALDGASDLLDHISLAPPPPLTEAEQFVVDKLGVPVRWIHEAKAVLARHRFNACNQPVEFSHLGSRVSPRSRRLSLKARLFALLEASHWLAADHTEAAHTVCVEFLLPDLVLHTDTSLSSVPGPSWPMCRLGHRLSRLLQPFDALPATKLPDRFAHGVGLYMMYSDILCLAESLARLCQPRARQASGPAQNDDGLGRTGELELSNVGAQQHREPDDDYDDDDDETEAAMHGQLASTLSALRTQLAGFTDQLQYMLTPNLNARVVRTEMATVCAHVISAFLIANATGTETTEDSRLMHVDEDTYLGTLDSLQQQLMAMTKVGLPADYHLREQSNLAEARLSIGLV